MPPPREVARRGEGRDADDHDAGDDDPDGRVGITRTAANDGFGADEAGAFGDRLRRAGLSRLAKNVNSPSPRVAQNAVAV